MAKRGSRGGRGDNGESKLAKVSVHDLKLELSRREGAINRLRARRSKLMESLSIIEKEIAGMGGSLAGGDGSRHRAHNSTNLIGALTEALTGATMSVTEVASEVQKRGYITTSPNFRTIVNQTLINSGKFKRMGRGLYTVKG